jgi:uncharacterized membrane protein
VREIRQRSVIRERIDHIGTSTAARGYRSTVESIFAFLFKYRPVVFERGQFAFGAAGFMRVAAIVAGVLALAAIATYVRTRPRGGERQRFVLGGLRVAVVLLLLFALLRPMLLVSAAVPQRNVVGVVVDDSRSMQIADLDGRTRADAVRALLGGRDSTLFKSLGERFVVRLFRTGAAGDRVNAVADLTWDGTRTRLAPALEGVRQELDGVPLSGLVLVSDGADNSGGALTETLSSLRARHVPVFTVGVGRERFAQDIEISRIDAPREVLEGASLVVDASVVQRGYGGQQVELIVEDSGRIVSTEKFTLPSDGEVASVRTRVPTTATGARPLTFRIAPLPGELVTENNTQRALVVVNDRREKVLYIEGEPRFELKFLRRAVESDENLQVVTLLRTAKDRFLRLSVDDSLDLLSGFPKSRDELFAYKGIVLGSIEASYFTLDQLRMLADFVGTRGGGLLMLGGRQSFAEGGYAGTPLAEVLPVELTAGREGDPAFDEIRVELTPAGARHATTQIAGTEAESAERWKTMPAVSTVNRIARTRPGAQTLLTGTSVDGDGKHIVMAFQRFGRGKSIALAIQDSWLWQMHADVPVDDQSHESFWRQTLRWLVSDVPGRVNVMAASDRAAPGEPVTLSAEVADAAFLRVNSAEATASVTSPSGAVQEVPLEWSVTRDGEYEVAFTPAESGVHRVEVTARVGGDTVASAPAFVEVGDVTNEFFGAELRSSLLRRVAEETGGRYYTPETVDALAGDLVYTEGGNTVVERMDLWDMPIIFLLLLGLLAGEWALRRKRGLA